MGLEASVRQGDPEVYGRLALAEELAILDRHQASDGILGHSANLRLARRHEPEPPLGVPPVENGGVLLRRYGRIGLLDAPLHVRYRRLEYLVLICAQRDLVAHPDRPEADRGAPADCDEGVDHELVHEGPRPGVSSRAHQSFLMARSFAERLLGLSSVSPSVGVTGRRVWASAPRVRRARGGG